MERSTHKNLSLWVIQIGGFLVEEQQSQNELTRVVASWFQEYPEAQSNEKACNENACTNENEKARKGKAAQSERTHKIKQNKDSLLFNPFHPPSLPGLSLGECHLTGNCELKALQFCPTVNRHTVSLCCPDLGWRGLILDSAHLSKLSAL